MLFRSNLILIAQSVAEAKSPAKAAAPELDPTLFASYKELYERYNGDLDLM